MLLYYSVIVWKVQKRAKIECFGKIVKKNLKKLLVLQAMYL
jgi:hypothetical protein